MLFMVRHKNDFKVLIISYKKDKVMELQGKKRRRKKK